MYLHRLPFMYLYGLNIFTVLFLSSVTYLHSSLHPIIFVVLSLEIHSRFSSLETSDTMKSESMRNQLK